jgi:aspartate aminotransferase
MIHTSELREAEQSETLFINDISKEIEGKGKTVYKFGFGQSPFFPPEYIINEVKEYAHRKEYMSVQGAKELRNAVAEFHGKLDGTKIDPNDVLIGPGSKMLIYMVMASFKSADVFLITPSWVSYEPQAHLAGHEVTRIQTSYENRWRLQPEDLEKAAASRTDTTKPIIMILNYPGNPDGLTYTGEELQAIATVCRKHNILVVSDEIYGLLNFEGTHTSFSRVYPEGTIVTTGLSKWCGAGGWRLGAAIVSPSLGTNFMDCMVGIASETYSTAAAPIQMAAIKAYSNSDELMNYLHIQRKILKLIGHYVWDELKKTGINVHCPEGGFYLNPDFSPIKNRLKNRNINNATEICESLMRETGVALLPGTAFGYGADSYVTRLAFVDFDGTKAIQEASKNDDPLDTQFLAAVCPKIIAGTKELVEWCMKD